MAAPRPTGRSRPTLLLLIAAALTLLTLQFRGVEPLNAFQQGMRDLLDPVRSISEGAARPVRTAWHGLFDYDDLRDRIRVDVRMGASPRHVPAVIIEVPELPRTRSGKLVELAVRAVVEGRPITNVEALANPGTLDHFRDLPELAP